jgi:Tripartite ATP-independent periplasmic transporters, DctQ component
LKSRLGARLSRFEAAWTRFESVSCAAVLALEIFAFTCWIALKGVSSTGSGGSRAGLVFRAVLGATAIGILMGRLARARSPRGRALMTLAAGGLGLVLGAASGEVGSAYCGNALNWLQDSSSLTLFGGLRGVGTALTWLLAMLGASLATGSGKHINVDALVRFLRARWQLPAILLGWVMASVVCLTSVWGFFDHIAIESFGAPASAAAGEKITIAMRQQGHHLFVLRKQLALDARAVVHVVAGDRYDAWLHGADWNDWIRGGGWEKHFTEEQVNGILLPETGARDLHPPLVVVPSGESNRGLLTRDLHLIFPFGLLVIGIRFLLRALVRATDE